MCDALKKHDTPYSSQTAPETEPTWNLLGLKVGRKTEIIALVAFVLSVSGVIWQIFNYTRGAVVRLFPTDQIVFASSDALGRNYAGQPDLLALVATMSYVNEGEIGNNAVIRREYISLSLGKLTVEHRWYEFGSTDIEDGNKLKFKRDSEARPFPAVAASATSHETLFAPWEIECPKTKTNCNPAANFLKWSDFVNAVKADPQVSIVTRAEIYPSKQVSVSCTVRLRDWEISLLEQQRWLTAGCVENNGSETPERKAQSTTKTPVQK